MSIAIFKNINIPAWTFQGITVQQEWLKNNVLYGNYGNRVINKIIDILHVYIPIKNQSVLVLGSVRPWLEVILLSLGASHITTLEYNPYPSSHPNISTVSPVDFAKIVQSDKTPLYDAMISFSSLEHSGLGRYY